MQQAGVIRTGCDEWIHPAKATDTQTIRSILQINRQLARTSARQAVSANQAAVRSHGAFAACTSSHLRGERGSSALGPKNQRTTRKWKTSNDPSTEASGGECASSSRILRVPSSACRSIDRSNQARNREQPGCLRQRNRSRLSSWLCVGVLRVLACLPLLPLGVAPLCAARLQTTCTQHPTLARSRLLIRGARQQRNQPTTTHPQNTDRQTGEKQAGRQAAQPTQGAARLRSIHYPPKQQQPRTSSKEQASSHERRWQRARGRRGAGEGGGGGGRP